MAVIRNGRRKEAKPIYAALIQPIPTDILWQYRSSDQTRFEGQEATMSGIKSSIRKHGPQGIEPLYVEYDPVYKTALVVDGQKRLVAAKAVGLKRIPVGVVYVCRPPYGHGPYEAKKVPTAKTERIKNYKECLNRGLSGTLANPYDVFGR